MSKIDENINEHTMGTPAGGKKYMTEIRQINMPIDNCLKTLKEVNLDMDMLGSKFNFSKITKKNDQRLFQKIDLNFDHSYGLETASKHTIQFYGK